MSEKEESKTHDDSQLDSIAPDWIDLNRNNTDQFEHLQNENNRKKQDDQLDKDEIEIKELQGGSGFFKWLLFPVKLKLEILMSFLPKEHKKSLKRLIRDILD